MYYVKLERQCLTSGVFLTKFEVFGNVVKLDLQCLIYLLNRNQNCKERMEKTVQICANKDQIFKAVTIILISLRSSLPLYQPDIL